MSSSISTAEYVKSAQSGDTAAWNILFQYHYPSLFAAALKICNDIPAAKDAVQEAFIKAHLKLKDLNDPMAFEAWVKKILVRNCYRNAYHSKNKHAVSLPLQTDVWWEDELNAKLEKLYVESRLYATLSNLSETLRSILLLRYFSEFQSYDEIARILCIPIGTVRSRLNQARIKLTEEWKQQADSDIEIMQHIREWNNFYYSHFSGVHYSDNIKNQFVSHLQKDVQVKIKGEKVNTGRFLFEKMIIEDRKAGSWLIPCNVATSGNISIVEAKHFNSPEHPTHCPSRSVLILYRDQNRVNKIHFHY